MTQPSLTEEEKDMVIDNYSAQITKLEAENKELKMLWNNYEEAGCAKVCEKVKELEAENTRLTQLQHKYDTNMTQLKQELADFKAKGNNYIRYYKNNFRKMIPKEEVILDFEKLLGSGKEQGK